MTPKRIFVLNGHPAETSLNRTLAEAYADAARAAGHEVLHVVERHLDRAGLLGRERDLASVELLQGAGQRVAVDQLELVRRRWCWRFGVLRGERQSR